MVKDGRMMQGKPIASSTCSASSMLCARDARGSLKADAPHRLVKEVAVLGLVDRLLGGTDHLHAECSPRERPRGRAPARS
jgi:hypothetical protein